MTQESWYNFRNLVGTGDYAGARKLISSNPALLKDTNSIGETVLHHLAVENNLEGVKWLFSSGATLDSQNHTGNPPVFEVALLNHKDLLTWFVASKADLTIRNNDGEDIWAFLEEMKNTKMSIFLKSLLA